jgi:hypothetical protein
LRPGEFYVGGEVKVRKNKKQIKDELQDRIFRFAIQTDVEDDSFLLQPLSFDDPEQVRYCIDGLTLALITYCYHKHPRGENYYEVMEELERTKSNATARRQLQKRADEAAAKQIPFIISLNKLVEEYYRLRQALEAFL